MTKKSKLVRIGVIGAGSMGQIHINSIREGKVSRCEVTAICDHDQSVAEKNPGLKFFQDYQELLKSGVCDAVLIVTPHYYHTTIGIAALKAGLHVLVEKPISVHKNDCLRLIAAHKNKKQVFAAMFNQRTDPYYIKIRELIRSGELGEVRRVQWTITNWFRSQRYYDAGAWRATWAGEGGGVLLNQCPHNIDLWWWMFGMPEKVTSHCTFGRYHKIEVEDDVTAYFSYKNGMTGVFITSTGEAPGTNRLEIAAERGRLVYENDCLHWLRNEVPMTKFSHTTPERFSTPPVWDITVPVHGGHGPQHVGILNNFVEAILDGKPLIAPAEEGIHSVELANAMIYSSVLGKTLELPLSATAYEKWLKSMIAKSATKKKTVVQAGGDDFSKSFR